MFYTNFVKLCNRKGIAPTAAAVEMGFHRSDATRWSKGAEPRRTTLEKVADYFGVTVADLIGDDAAQKEKPTAQGDGLTEKQKYAIELIKSTSDDDLDKLIEMFKIWTGEK